MIPEKSKKNIDIKPSSSHYIDVSEDSKFPYTLTLIEGEA